MFCSNGPALKKSHYAYTFSTLQCSNEVCVFHMDKMSYEHVYLRRPKVQGAL